jgi:hypothetical protein
VPEVRDSQQNSNAPKSSSQVEKKHKNEKTNISFITFTTNEHSGDEAGSDLAKTESASSNKY